MEMIEATVEHLPRHVTVLLVRHWDPVRDELFERLQERDLGALGPGYTSDPAPRLTSHACADLARVGLNPAQDSGPHALARRRRETWSIPAVLLEAPA